tara:strand:+ start:114 stop:356 length:243 start_codon:yes stop_codon:yes gene_type:complete
MDSKFVINSQGHLARPEQADVEFKQGDRVKLYQKDKFGADQYGTIKNIRNPAFGAPYVVKTDAGWAAPFMYCDLDLADRS